MIGFIFNEAYKKLSEYSIHLPYNYYSETPQKLTLSANAKETSETSPEERLASNLVSYNNLFMTELKYLRLAQNHEDLISQLILNTLRTHNSSPISSEFNYNSEVIKYIQYLRELNINNIDFDVKYSALFTISKKLGNSCLLLDTSTNQGFFELIGIFKALEEFGQVPKIVVGEGFWGGLSAALCCVMGVEKAEELILGCDRSEGFDFDELDDIKYNNNSNRSIFNYLYNSTNSQKLNSRESFRSLSNLLELIFNNLTFYDVYLKFGKILNLIIHSSESNYSPILFNYLSTPNVLVKSIVFRLYAIEAELADEEALVMERDPHTGDLIPYNLIHEKLICNSLSNNYLSNKLGQLFNINYIINCKEEKYTISSNFDISSRANFAWVSKFAELCKDEMVVKLVQFNQLNLLPAPVQKALQVNEFGEKLVTQIEVKNPPEMQDEKLTTLDKLKLIKSGFSSAKLKVEEICDYREIEVEVASILKSMRDEIRGDISELIRRRTIKDIREDFKNGNRLSTIRSGNRAVGDEGRFNNRRNQTI